MDITEHTDYRHFQREECYSYLAKFSQRQKSGCYSEVNVLVISEVTARSVSMKLQQDSVLRRRQQRRQNIKDLKTEEGSRVSQNQSFNSNTGSTSSGISFVVLSDSDSSQPDGNIIDLTVVSETEDQELVIKRSKKQPTGKSRDGWSSWLSHEDETQKVGESHKDSSRTVQKVVLAPGAMSEDTLGKFRVMSNTTELETRSGSPVKPLDNTLESTPESAFNESRADVSVQSAPSSPDLTVNTNNRCRECERRFTDIRRQPPPKTKTRDKNPASLLCDQWVLLKKWHPQRGRHREKGSLRRCNYLTSIQTDPSSTTEKSQHRRRQRPLVWPPIGGRKPVKRKSSMNNTLSPQLLTPKLRMGDTQKDKSLLLDEFSGSNASSRQNSGAPLRQKKKNAQDRFEEQEGYDGTEGTRRGLKLDSTAEVVVVENAKGNRSNFVSMLAAVMKNQNKSKKTSL